MLGYEIPLTIAMIGPAISARSLSLSRIVQSQTVGLWYLLTQPIGFAIVTICFLAELQWIPFDAPKAETEIVAGWLVEFSGKKLALLRLAKDFKLVLAASLMASLYLGGSLGPWQLHPTLYFLAKLIICILILSNLRALFARFRIDQALKGAWKYLTPLALLQVALVKLISVVIP
jgi:NADH-quinone oxidoreductase subunit H